MHCNAPEEAISFAKGTQAPCVRTDETPAADWLLVVISSLTMVCARLGTQARCYYSAGSSLGYLAISFHDRSSYVIFYILGSLAMSLYIQCVLYMDVNALIDFCTSGSAMLGAVPGNL